MKNALKSIALATLAVSTIAVAAPQYPFPQNKQYAYGHIFNPDLKKTESSIRQKFDNWKNLWVSTDYDVNGIKTAYIADPTQSSFNVNSRNIANGMLLAVYMASASDDTQELFDQLLNFYRCFPAKGQSKNVCDSRYDSKYNIDIMSSEVTKGSTDVYTTTLAYPDADFDAALALFMADKQWGSEGNMDYAALGRSLIGKIMESDIVKDSLKIKGYSWDYNPAFNPSYAALANFQVFFENHTNEFVANNWQDLIPAVTAEVFLCQDSSTGLVPGWCDWKTHTPCKVEQYEEGPGFNHDALRTPWRMAQAYYWYGNKDAKKFNDKIVKWLPYASYEHASYIRNNYNLDGSYSIDALSPYGDAAEVGGVGLAMASADDPKFYLETVYESLLNLPAKTPSHATESILQLLLLTGNMPDLTHIEITKDIATASVMRQPQMPKGMQDSSLKVSGFGNWTTKANGFNKIAISPDSTKKPLFADDGKALVKAEMRAESSVGKECSGVYCDDRENVFSGLALYLDDKYQDLSDVDTIRMTLRTQGVIGASALCYGKNEEGNRITYWEKNLIHPSEEFTTLSFSINNYDMEKESMGKVKGFVFEPMMTPGGYASIEIQDIKFLDKDGKLAKLYEELGIDTTQQPVKFTALKTSKPGIHVAGRTIDIQNSKVANAQLFDMQGRLLLEKTIRPNGTINVPRAGSYILRLNGQAIPVKIRE